MNTYRISSIYNGFIAAMLITVTFFTSCTDEELEVQRLDESKYISFSAAMNETRSTVARGSSEHLTIQEEEWPLHDKASGKATRGAIRTSLKDLNVGIYAYGYNKSNSASDVIEVNEVMANNAYKFIDNEKLRPTDTPPVMWSAVGKEYLYAYGYAPYKEDNADNFTRSTADGVTTLTYTVPSNVTEQTDIIASRINTVDGDYKQSIPLIFEHILTGVRFKAGFDCTVKSLKVFGVYNTGSFVIGDSWKEQQTVATFELPLPENGKQCTAGNLMTDGENILMMIPQRVPDNAYVEMIYTEGGGSPQTITASLKGHRWGKGSLITYTINKQSDVEYIYFDLAAGNFTINGDTYSGAYYKDGTLVKISNGTHSAENVYYIYQSTETNRSNTGYIKNTSTNEHEWVLPQYPEVTYNGKSWSEFITNNDNVEEVIEVWDNGKNINGSAAVDEGFTNVEVVRAAGRTHTKNRIHIEGNVGSVNLVIENIYSTYHHRGSGATVNRERTQGGISFRPGSLKNGFEQDGNSTLTINYIGDNRLGCIHYENNDPEKNCLVFEGTGSLTVADADFFKQTEYGVTGYYANRACAAIGSRDQRDGLEGFDHAYNMVFNSGILFVGATKAEFCTAIGGGGNGNSTITINGGSITAVASGTGTAIGGGTGLSYAGGIGNVTINNGNVYAYNHANIINIPTSAIGGAGSRDKQGSAGNVNINGGYVYAKSDLGTAIGGGSSQTKEGGDANIKITGGYIVAKTQNHESTCIGGGTGGNSTVSNNSSTPAYGGSAIINVSGEPTIRTGSIGGGGTVNSKGKIGSANITIGGGDISAQFILAGGAGAESTFTMTGGQISNSDVLSKEYYHTKTVGGALYMEDGTFTMSGGTIRNCKAEKGGAVYIQKSDNAIKNPKVTMNNNYGGGTIENCVSQTDGGAIYLEGGDVELAGGVIQNNVARTGNGGGIYIAAGNFEMSNGSDASVCNNSALKGSSNNSGNGNGGGIYVTSQTSDVNVYVYSGSITENSCDNNGGGICVDMSGNENAAANVVIGNAGNTEGYANISDNRAVLYGGGLYAIGENAMVTINGGNIMGNSVANYVPNENVTNEYGTVVLNGGNVTHVTVTFDGNADNAVINGEGNKAYQKIVTATNTSLVLPEVSRSLYDFVGWNSRSDGKGSWYENEQTMNIKEDVTMYAIWEAQ